jgi:predicted alpha-1,2-mannosidase
MRAEATKPNKIRPGLKAYEAKGYLPSDKENYGCCNFYGSVSTAEEYETADFAIAAFAHHLGDSSAARFFAQRAQNWKNNFNLASGFMQPKLKNGHFAPHFDPTSGQGFVEGDSYQYTPMVPFNVHGLIQAAGGNARYMRYLDKFFRKLNTDGNSRYAWQGNEPGLEIPWEYDYAGQPWRTQKVVRRIQDELYKAEPAGEAGNDDLGAMSSWYVWSALGLYPETPGTADFALGSPLFKHMTVYLPNGKTIAIDAPNASDATPYVQKLTLDGRKWAHNYLRPSILKHGAKLKFKLSSKPNRQRGTKPEDAPPSYSQF